MLSASHTLKSGFRAIAGQRVEDPGVDVLPLVDQDLHKIVGPGNHLESHKAPTTMTAFNNTKSKQHQFWAFNRLLIQY